MTCRFAVFTNAIEPGDGTVACGSDRATAMIPPSGANAIASTSFPTGSACGMGCCGCGA